MNQLSLIFAAVLAAGFLGQGPAREAPPSLERLCGKLVHYEGAWVHGRDKTRNLPHVPVRLYPAVDREQCCEGLAAKATLSTGHWGDFEFKPKGISAGFYWLEVEPNGREYKILIEYAPKKHWGQMCTQTVWEVDDAGKLRHEQLMTID
jgi:hypothetical protein